MSCHVMPSIESVGAVISWAGLSWDEVGCENRRLELELKFVNYLRRTLQLQYVYVYMKAVGYGNHIISHVKW